jgi:predicted  nucleic acid-binding Zn-ribbon protein
MEIPEQLTLLAELSAVEAKRKAALAVVESLPAEAEKAKEEAVAKREVHTEHDRRRHEIEMARRSLESDLNAEKDKLRKWETRADTIRGEREHAALLSEIGAQRRSISRHENDVLERMQELEDVNAALAEAGEAADAAELAAEEEWEKVAADVKAAQAEADGFTKQRDALSEKLPPPVMKRYHRIAERYGNAIAIIRGEACTTCHTSMPPQLVVQIYKGELLETCPSCQRILVHEAMTRAPEATDAEASADADDDGESGAAAPA